MFARLRSGVTVVALIAALTTGCQSRPRKAGEGLPVADATSRALPGSVDAADAPGAAVTSTDQKSVTTFHDPKIGLTFAYPSDWRPLSAAGPMYAPRLREKVHSAVTTQAFLPAGTPLAQTNLVGLSFSWAVEPNLSAPHCALLGKTLVQAAAMTRETLNGVAFSRADGGDAGMCHQMRSTIDSTMHRDGCYLFERDMETICPGVKGPGQSIALTAEQTAALKRQLDGVMASVRLE